MKELILDLQKVDRNGGDTWADCPARHQLEEATLDYAGKIIRVHITLDKNYRQSKVMRVRHE